MDLKKVFPIFYDNEIHYLDTAATSQKPKAVIEKIIEK